MSTEGEDLRILLVCCALACIFGMAIVALPVLLR